MKRIAITLILMLTSVGVVLASGQSPAAEEKNIMEMSWDEIVAQAKEEGEVVWYNWFLQDALRPLMAGFEAEYGVEVIIPDGTNDGNTQKLLAERDRATGDIDVMSTGGNATDTIDLSQLYYGPITDILPDGAKLRTAINGGDAKGFAVAYWGNQTGIAYDPLRIDEADLPQTIEEFSAYMAANPGDLGFNYENGGAGPSFIQNVARHVAPDVDFSDPSDDAAKMAELASVWDFFNSREDQFGITGGNADSLTRLNDGEFVLVPAWEDHLAGLQNKNEIDRRIKFYIPEFGMNGGGNIIGVPLNAPHPAAAILLVDWLTSAETQTLFNGEMGTAPQHPDADASQALVSMDQRAYQTDWLPSPFGQAFMAEFIANVIQD